MYSIVYSLANLEQHLAPGQAASPYGILNTQQNTEVLYSQAVYEGLLWDFSC